jgi:hypothetical protein
VFARFCEGSMDLVTPLSAQLSRAGEGPPPFPQQQACICIKMPRPLTPACLASTLRCRLHPPVPPQPLL